MNALNFDTGDNMVVCDICGKPINKTGHSDKQVDICSNCTKIPAVIDNFDKIGSIMEFDTPNTFYWIQVIKRRKDNPGMHGDYIQYGSYCVHSYEELLRIKSELIKLSRAFNARVVLWVNRRNMQELMLPVAQIALEYIQNKQSKALPSIFEHTCGKHMQKNIDSLYIVDVDSKEESYLNKVLNVVKDCAECNPNFEIVKILPTLHGYHIICYGFNLKKFEQLCVIENLGKIDVHKDNPTVLYFCPQ